MAEIATIVLAIVADTVDHVAIVVPSVAFAGRGLVRVNPAARFPPGDRASPEARPP